MLSNLKNYFITQIIVGTTYYLVKMLTPFKPIELQLTEFDNLFEPKPVAVWIYMSFFFLLMAGITFSSKEDSVKCCKIILFNSFIASIFYIMMPTKLPYYDFAPYFQEGTITYEFLKMIKTYDDTYNCFPSLHIANSLIATYFLMKGKNSLIKTISFTWMALVIWSVLSTKQHVYYDVLSGALVSYISYIVITKLSNQKKLNHA